MKNKIKKLVSGLAMIILASNCSNTIAEAAVKEIYSNVYCIDSIEGDMEEIMDIIAEAYYNDERVTFIPTSSCDYGSIVCDNYMKMYDGKLKEVKEDRLEDVGDRLSTFDFGNGTFYMSQVRTYAKEINWKNKPPVKECNENEDMTEYEKIKLIHDWVCDTLHYDFGSNNLTDSLMTGKAVCWQYSFIFHNLLKAAGIESRLLMGWGQKEAHEWNMVKCDGKWYYCDITWDDATNTTGYLLRGKSFEKDHTVITMMKQMIDEFYEVSAKDYKLK